jgi:hypothetical protein
MLFLIIFSPNFICVVRTVFRGEVTQSKIYAPNFYYAVSFKFFVLTVKVKGTYAGY